MKKALLQIAGASFFITLKIILAALLPIALPLVI